MEEQHPRTNQERTEPRGVFITIEGGDGAGKTTQAARLVAYLEALGHQVCHIHEPGGTALGERVRSILLDNFLDSMDPVAELLLYEAARAQIVAERIIPALEQGRIVVCDRFTDSTLAYQGYGRELNIPMVAHLNGIAAQGVVPDRTVLLSIDSALGIGRATAADGKGDRMEQAGAAFHERVSLGFGQLAAAEPQRFRVVDAFGTPDEVFTRILAALSDLIGEARD